MSAGEIVITAYITFVSAGLAVLVWRQITELRRELHVEIAELRRELHSEIGGVRSEIVSLRSDLTSEIGSLRSDLTQVALAVGARRPRASEG